MKEAVVKIDAELLGEVEEFIGKRENRLKYAHKKQFINIAVLEKLNQERKKRR
jgi:hypothetical protein